LVPFFPRRRPFPRLFKGLGLRRKSVPQLTRAPLFSNGQLLLSFQTGSFQKQSFSIESSIQQVFCERKRVPHLLLIRLHFIPPARQRVREFPPLPPPLFFLLSEVMRAPFLFYSRHIMLIRFSAPTLALGHWFPPQPLAPSFFSSHDRLPASCPSPRLLLISNQSAASVNSGLTIGSPFHGLGPCLPFTELPPPFPFFFPSGVAFKMRPFHQGRIFQSTPLSAVNSLLASLGLRPLFRVVFS